MKTIPVIVAALLAVSARAALELGPAAADTNATRTTVDVLWSLAGTNSTAPTVTLYWAAADMGTNAGSWSYSTNLGAVAAASYTNRVGALTPSRPWYFRLAAADASNTVWTTNYAYSMTLSGAPTSPAPGHAFVPVMADSNGVIVAPAGIVDFVTAGGASLSGTAAAVAGAVAVTTIVHSADADGAYTVSPDAALWRVVCTNEVSTNRTVTVALPSLAAALLADVEILMVASQTVSEASFTTNSITTNITAGASPNDLGGTFTGPYEEWMDGRMVWKRTDDLAWIYQGSEAPSTWTLNYAGTPPNFNGPEYTELGGSPAGVYTGDEGGGATGTYTAVESGSDIVVTADAGGETNIVYDISTNAGVVASCALAVSGVVQTNLVDGPLTNGARVGASSLFFRWVGDRWTYRGQRSWTP